MNSEMNDGKLQNRTNLNDDVKQDNINNDDQIKIVALIISVVAIILTLICAVYLLRSNNEENQ